MIFRTPRFLALPTTAGLLVLTLAAGLAATAAAGEFRFEAQEIETELSVGYAVRVLDMNGDEKPDIVVVDTNRVVWYENPTWKRHTLIEDQTKLDNVCFAPYDITGDGRIDFALGADWRPRDTVGSGSLQWITPGKPGENKPGEKWNVHPIGQEPTVHRMAWADFDGDGRGELIVVPLFGRGATAPHFRERPLRILSYKIPADPVRGPWIPEVIDESLHVAHGFEVVDFDGDGRLDMLVASFEGVSLLKRGDDGQWSRKLLATGSQETSPNTGASEVTLGRLGDGSRYIATIEPWHGFQVVCYTLDPPQTGAVQQWRRHVIDDQLKWGHVVWCADLDGDGEQELIAGVRDDAGDGVLSGIRIYDPQDASGTAWKRTLLNPGQVAVEDATAADLNGDGRPDIVAVGRATRNIVIYWNRTPPSAKNE